MSGIFMLLSLVGGLASLVGSIFILIHAFQRSVGTGFMVLCIPCYIFYYAFTQFEHPKKQMILGVWLGGVALNILGSVGQQAMR